MKLVAKDIVCEITKRVVNDFNTLGDQAFFNKYSCKKSVYLKRFVKYGDPYMNAPLAKLGKFLSNMMR